jgi:hypothetical protein
VNRGKSSWRGRADGLAAGQPTAEPSVRASARDAATNQYWWSNRVQTLRAAFEAETLAFVFLLTGEEKYREAARRYLLSLARLDADGPTNFTLNCEAAKPLVHRLARAYDWAFDALSEAVRAEVRRVLKRRGEDAWNSWEALQGKGHLNQPYGSHANRHWHKLATIGEIPDADQWLDFAVTKFYAWIAEQIAPPVSASPQQRASFAPAQAAALTWPDQESGARLQILRHHYYVTTFGKDILAAGLKLRELVIIPQLAYGRVA